MSDQDEFLQSVLPRLVDADTALHNGDPEPRKAMWSQKEPVTLFGAALSATGAAEINGIFDRLGSRFSNCESFDYEVVAAEASGDLAYVVGFEQTTASVDGAAPEHYSLRVTTLFRREDGEWRVVHRHADPAEATSQIERLRPSSPD